MDTTRLRFLIDESEKTQKEIAADLGLSQQRFNYYVNGQREPDTDTLCKISSYFKVSINFLIGGSMDSFWSTPYIEALRQYCNIVGSNFNKIINYYQEHPQYIRRIQSGREMTLPEREGLKKILGGVEPAAAVCLGCSVLDNVDDYSEFYLPYHDATPEVWEILARIVSLPEKTRKALLDVLDATLKGFEAGTKIYSLSHTDETHSAGSAKHDKRPMIPAAARGGNVTEIEAIYPDELPDDEPIP